MSLTLGQGWQVNEPLPVPPPPDPQEELLARVYMAVEALQATFAAMPSPVVNVAPNDLTDIVTAVQDLKGPGISAEDIAAAVRDALVTLPQPAPAEDTVTPALVKALKDLDFRMKGIGAGGTGGTVATISNDVAVKPAAGTAPFPVSGTLNVSMATANLVSRMNARQPQDNYSLWLDVASSDSTRIYIAEAPTGTTGATASFQGIRITLDASGNPLGAVETATGFAWNSRAAATWTS